jgi:hypothetical protein
MKKFILILILLFLSSCHNMFQYTYYNKFKIVGIESLNDTLNIYYLDEMYKFDNGDVDGFTLIDKNDKFKMNDTLEIIKSNSNKEFVKRLKPKYFQH